MKKSFCIIFFLARIIFAQWVDTTSNSPHQTIDQPFYTGNIMFEGNYISFNEYPAKNMVNVKNYFEFDSGTLSYSGKLLISKNIQFEFRPGLSAGNLLFGLNVGLFVRSYLYKNLFGCFGANIFTAINIGESSNSGYSGIKRGLFIFPGASVGYRFYKDLKLIISYYYSGVKSFYSSYSRQSNVTRDNDLSWIIKIGVEI